MSKLRSATPDEEREWLATPPARLAKLQAHGKKLRAQGKSEAEIRRATALYEAELIEQEQNAPESAPEGLTKQQIAGLNLERASQGLPAYATEDDERDLPLPTSADIASMMLHKAHGFAPESDPDDRFAPPGTHPTRLARMNLDRACTGLPALLPHPDDEE